MSLRTHKGQNDRAGEVKDNTQVCSLDNWVELGSLHYFSWFFIASEIFIFPSQAVRAFEGRTIFFHTTLIHLRILSPELMFLMVLILRQLEAQTLHPDYPHERKGFSTELEGNTQPEGIRLVSDCRRYIKVVI